MSPATTKLFFELVNKFVKEGYKDTPQFRMAILNELAKMGKMSRMYETKRTTDEVVSDMRKQGFNVLDRRKPSHVSSGNNRGFFRSLMGRCKRILERVVKAFTMGDTK